MIRRLCECDVLLFTLLDEWAEAGAGREGCVKLVGSWGPLWNGVSHQVKQRGMTVNIEGLKLY
jgi:hypothetical protein